MEICSNTDMRQEKKTPALGLNNSMSTLLWHQVTNRNTDYKIALIALLLHTEAFVQRVTFFLLWEKAFYRACLNKLNFTFFPLLFYYTDLKALLGRALVGVLDGLPYFKSVSQLPLPITKKFNDEDFLSDKLLPKILGTSKRIIP